MKVVKRVFLTIGIVIGILLALAIIGIGYLFVVPSGSIFGYHLVAYNRNNVSASHLLETGAESVEIDAGPYNIELKVENSSTGFISVTLTRDVTALLKTGEGDIGLSFNYDRLTHTSTTGIYEPAGLKLRGEGKMAITISSAILNRINKLSINTTTGNIFLFGNNGININNLNLNTKRGSISLGDVSLTGNLIANIGAGVLTSTSNTKINLAHTSITSSRGQSNLNVSSANYSFGDFEYNNTATGYLYLPTISSLTYSGNGGKVYIEQVGQLDFTSKNTNLTVNKITTGAYINVSGEGNVNVNECEAYSEMNLRSGNITIDEATDILSLSTTSGNIRVNNARKLVDATTTSGNIYINYSDSVSFYEQDAGSRQVLATTTSGKIDLHGVDYVDVAVKSSAGYVSVVFHDIASKQSKIQTQSANVFVQVPKGSPLEGDTNGAQYIVRILSNETPSLSSGFGDVIHSEDNLFIIYAYDANTSTAAQLDIICVAGKATITNGI